MSIYEYFQRNTKLQNDINDKIRCYIIDYEGEVDIQNNGKKIKYSDNYSFLENHLFNTHDKSKVKIKMTFGNTVKVLPNTEIIAKPSLYNKDNLAVQDIKEAHIELNKGEITSEIVDTKEGKGNLIIEVSDLKIIGIYGLFKVIYDKESDKGKVIVKNGLVKVNKKNLKTNHIKVSGLHELSFKKGEFDIPYQSNIIQYDWK